MKLICFKGLNYYGHGNFHGLFEVQIKKGPWVWVARGPLNIFLIRCLVKSLGQTRCFGFATTTSGLDRFCKFDVCVD